MTLLTLGALVLIDLVADVVGRSTPLPRVSVLLISGVLIGPGGLVLLDRACRVGLVRRPWALAMTVRRSHDETRSHVAPIHKRAMLNLSCTAVEFFYNRDCAVQSG